MRIYKKRAKRFHDSRLLRKEFHIGQHVLLFNSRLKLIAGKLRSRWDGLFIITDIFPHGAVQVKDEATGRVFKVNGHQLKPFHGVPPDERRHDVVDLALIPPMMVEEVSHLAP